MANLQRLLTIPPERIMQVLVLLNEAGTRVVTIAPHYNAAAMLMGYLVVIEPASPEGAPR